MSNGEKTLGKYHEDSAPFGFEEWGLEIHEQFNDLIRKMIVEGLQRATKEYECHAWFPIQWGEEDGVGGAPPRDVTTIYVELPLGPEEDSNPRWSFSLSDLVDDMIRLNEEGGEGGAVSGEEDRENFAAVRDKLREYADRIDAVLKRKGRDQP